MNQEVLLASFVFLVTWTCAEGIPQSNSFFVEQSDSFNYRANDRCLNVPKSSPRRFANHMMDLMRNIEGDESFLINNMTGNLIRAGFSSRKVLIEPELEPSEELTPQDFDTFSKMAALVWLAVTDPVGVKQNGWCSIKKLNTFLSISTPAEVVNKLQSLEQSISQDIRLILENFIKSIVWPANKIKRPSLELTKFYKSNKRQRDSISTTDIAQVADDADKSPIARSIMHLEVDSEDSDEESTEIIKIPIITPTPTGAAQAETRTFRTHHPPTTPSLRTMIIHTTPPYHYTPPVEHQQKKDVTHKTLLIEEDEDSDSDGELDIRTKSPYKTKLTTVDDGFFLEDDFVTQKTTLVVDHIPVVEDTLPTTETTTTEEYTNANTVIPEYTTSAQAEAVSQFISYVTQPTLLPEEDSKEDDSSSESKSDSNDLELVNEEIGVAVNNTASVVEEETPSQRRVNTESEQDMPADLDAINAKPTVVIAVTVAPRLFTDDDTEQFVKLVSVDEKQLQVVSDNLERNFRHLDDYYDSNVKEYPIVSLILLCNLIFWLCS